MASVSTIVEVLDALLTWAENNETLVLAMITTISVLVSSFWSKRMIEENSDLVEANKDAIEQTRKDHKRESVKDLIIQLYELRRDIPRPRTPQFSSGPYTVGRKFKKLDGWKMEIPGHLRRFIREETTNDSPDLLGEYDDYKSNYKEYNSKYDSLKREISSFLEVYYDEVDWPETRSVNPDIPLQRGRSMTIDEAKQKLRNESERIAENIITEGLVFQGRKDKDLTKAVYDLVEDRYREDFDYLQEEPYNLQEQYENLTRPTSRFRIGYIGLFSSI